MKIDKKGGLLLKVIQAIEQSDREARQTINDLHKFRQINPKALTVKYARKDF
jgi:hypothetical protein